MGLIYLLILVVIVVWGVRHRWSGDSMMALLFMVGISLAIVRWLFS